MGVDEEDVFTDYLTTNDQFLPALQPVFDEVAAQGLDPTLLEPVLGVRAEYLQITLDRVAAIGGLSAYLTDLEVDGAVRDQLAQRLLG